MNTVIGIVSTVIGVLVLFLVIRYAVQLGVTDALRKHEAWRRDAARKERNAENEADRLAQARAARVAERADQEAEAGAILRAQQRATRVAEHEANLRAQRG